MTASEAAQLRTLEGENRPLKKFLAKQLLDNALLKELVGKKLDSPAALFAAVKRVIGGHGYSDHT